MISSAELEARHPRENAAPDYKCDHGREERAQFYQLQPLHEAKDAPDCFSATRSAIYRSPLSRAVLMLG
jgi:hypothetical protein